VANKATAELEGRQQGGLPVVSTDWAPPPVADAGSALTMWCCGAEGLRPVRPRSRGPCCRSNPRPGWRERGLGVGCSATSSGRVRVGIRRSRRTGAEGDTRALEAIWGHGLRSSTARYRHVSTAHVMSRCRSAPWPGVGGLSPLIGSTPPGGLRTARSVLVSCVAARVPRSARCNVACLEGNLLAARLPGASGPVPNRVIS